jgi:hypothetical protein
LLPPAAAWAEADPAARPGYCGPGDPAAVTLVIDYQDLGRPTDVFCVSNLDATASAADVLRAAGVAVTGTTQSGPEFICRLAGLPAPDQPIGIPGNPDYVETCAVTPPAAAYWSYWQAAPGGDWAYSLRGSAASRVHLGGFEGFSFAHNAAQPKDAQPRTAPVASANSAATADPAATSPATAATAGPGPAADGRTGLSAGTAAAVAAVLVLGLGAAAVAARRGRRPTGDGR